MVKIASPAKALIDFLYLRPFNSMGELKDYLKETGRFNWEAFSKGDRAAFAKIADGSGSLKLKTASRILQKIWS